MGYQEQAKPAVGYQEQTEAAYGYQETSESNKYQPAETNYGFQPQQYEMASETEQPKGYEINQSYGAKEPTYSQQEVTETYGKYNPPTETYTGYQQEEMEVYKGYETETMAPY